MSLLGAQTRGRVVAADVDVLVAAGVLDGFEVNVDAQLGHEFVQVVDDVLHDCVAVLHAPVARHEHVHLHELSSPRLAGAQRVELDLLR